MSVCVSMFTYIIKVSHGIYGHWQRERAGKGAKLIDAIVNEFTLVNAECAYRNGLTFSKEGRGVSLIAIACVSLCVRMCVCVSVCVSLSGVHYAKHSSYYDQI